MSSVDFNKIKRELKDDEMIIHFHTTNYNLFTGNKKLKIFCFNRISNDQTVVFSVIKKQDYDYVKNLKLVYSLTEMPKI